MLLPNSYLIQIPKRLLLFPTCQALIVLLAYVIDIFARSELMIPSFVLQDQDSSQGSDSNNSQADTDNHGRKCYYYILLSCFAYLTTCQSKKIKIALNWKFAPSRQDHDLERCYRRHCSRATNDNWQGDIAALGTWPKCKKDFSHRHLSLIILRFIAIPS